jgi:hypothetical protein
VTKTNAFSILCVVVRFFAIWMFVESIVALAGYFALPAQAHEDLRPQFLAQQGFVMVFSVFFWIFADKVARLALARPQQQVFESGLSVDDWQTVAFSTLGAWEAIQGLIYLGQRIIHLIILHFGQDARPLASLPDDFFGWMATEALRLVIGLALLFGSRGLVGMIRRYRQVGMTDVYTPAAQAPAADGDDDQARRQ